MPHTPVDVIQRAGARRPKRTTKSSKGVVIATCRVAEQGKPPLDSPRKGGGNGECRMRGNKEGKL